MKKNIALVLALFLPLAAFGQALPILRGFFTTNQAKIVPGDATVNISSNPATGVYSITANLAGGSATNAIGIVKLNNAIILTGVRSIEFSNSQSVVWSSFTVGATNVVLLSGVASNAVFTNITIYDSFNKAIQAINGAINLTEPVYVKSNLILQAGSIAFGDASGLTNYLATNLNNQGSAAGQVLTATAGGVTWSNSAGGTTGNFIANSNGVGTDTAIFGAIITNASLASTNLVIRRIGSNQKSTFDHWSFGSGDRLGLMDPDDGVYLKFNDGIEFYDGNTNLMARVRSSTGVFTGDGSELTNLNFIGNTASKVAIFNTNKELTNSPIDASAVVSTNANNVFTGTNTFTHPVIGDGSGLTNITATTSTVADYNTNGIITSNTFSKLSYYQNARRHAMGGKAVRGIDLWFMYAQTDAAARVKAVEMIAWGLRDHGYTWFSLPSIYTNYSNGAGAYTNRWLNGGFEIDTNRFPNITNLVSDLHAMGLKVNAYGEPSVTVANDIIIGAAGHETEFAQGLANIGFDRLQYDPQDNGTAPTNWFLPLLERMSAAIDDTGRPIWMRFMVPLVLQNDYFPSIRVDARLSTIESEFCNASESVLPWPRGWITIFLSTRNLGRHPELVGRDFRPEATLLNWTLPTEAYRAQFSMNCMLMAGFWLNSSGTPAVHCPILTNDTALAILDDPGYFQARQIYSTDTNAFAQRTNSECGQIWVRPLGRADGPNYAACFINWSTNTSTNLTLQFTNAGFAGPKLLSDIWNGTNCLVTNSVTFTVPTNSCVLVTLSNSDSGTLNGSALVVGTVNSNKLDAATLAALQAGGTVGNFIANSSGKGTNTTFYGSPNIQGSGNNAQLGFSTTNLGSVLQYDATGFTTPSGFYGTFSGNGSGLTNLDGTKITGLLTNNTSGSSVTAGTATNVQGYAGQTLLTNGQAANVGIGTNSPLAALHVRGLTNQYILKLDVPSGASAKTATYDTNGTFTVAAFTSVGNLVGGADGLIALTGRGRFASPDTNSMELWNSTKSVSADLKLGSLFASNSVVFPPAVTGPVNITNGLSAFWNSNGVYQFLRLGPVGKTTNQDFVIGTFPP